MSYENEGSEEIESNGVILGQVDCYLKVIKKNENKKSILQKDGITNTPIIATLFATYTKEKPAKSIPMRVSEN